MLNLPMKSILICIGILLLGPSFIYAQKKPKKKFRLPTVLSEVSGLFYAGPDSLWWHNDSGDAPRLFLTDGGGKLIRTVNLPQIRHVDWEDLTADDQGRIYIGDFGNNANQRKDLRIYRFDPPSGQIDSIDFHLADQKAFPPPPEQANFDLEAFFWANDSLHLFSKNRLQKGNYFSKHYILPATIGTQEAKVKDSIFLRKRVVTGAAISPDYQTVALIGYNYKRFLGFIPISAASVFTFTEFSGTRYLKGKMKRRALSFIVSAQYESIDFIDDEFAYVASEKTSFIRARAKRKRIKEKIKALTKN